MAPQQDHRPLGSARVGQVLPYLVLPSLALFGLLVAAGPEIWSATYASIKGLCQAYLGDISPRSVALAIGASIGLVSLVAGLLTAIKELRRLHALSRALEAASGSRSPWEDSPSRPVIVQDSRTFAFCHGLRRPRIYVSTALVELLTAEELDAVLRHEAIHARRKDPARMIIAKILAGAFFALPLTRFLRDRYLVQLEVEADRQVARELGLKPLAGALLKLIPVTTHAEPNAPYSPFSVTEERVKRLLAERGSPTRAPQASRRVLLVNAALVAGVGGFSLLAIQGLGLFLASAPFCRIPLA